MNYNESNSEWTQLLAILETWRTASRGRHWKITSKYVPEDAPPDPAYPTMQEDMAGICVKCFSDSEAPQEFEADRLEWITHKARHALRSMEDRKP